MPGLRSAEACPSSCSRGNPAQLARTLLSAPAKRELGAPVTSKAGCRWLGALLNLGARLSLLLSPTSPLWLSSGLGFTLRSFPAAREAKCPRPRLLCPQNSGPRARGSSPTCLGPGSQSTESFSGPGLGQGDRGWVCRLSPMPDRGPRGPGSTGGEAGGQERLGCPHGACQLGFDGGAQTKWKPSIKHQTVLWAAEAHRLFISGARAPTLTAGRGRRSRHSESLLKLTVQRDFCMKTFHVLGTIF